MKLNEMSSSVDVKTNIQMKSIKAELSQDKLHKMWDLLQSPYRDPISSLIREYTSNAFDAHVEANVDTPVYITLEEDQSGWYWACEDFGVGISEDRAQNIFMKYLNSTKEETNDQIGAFGMGSKSGLGYTDVIHIRTRYNGTEYNYMLHKTTDAPTLSQVSIASTNKRNGTKIKVYLKDTYSEVDTFITKTKQQLDYFDNIVYGGKLQSINSKFDVFDLQNFKYKPNSQWDEVHILIGKVVYPINLDALGKNSPDEYQFISDLPIALNFDIGDLPVIFTREDIRYTDKAVRLIKEKYQKAIQEIVDITFPKKEETDDLETYVEYLSNTAKLKFTTETESYTFTLPPYIHSLRPSNTLVYTPNPYVKFLVIGHKHPNKIFDDIFKYTLTCQRQLKNGRNFSLNNNWGQSYKYNYTHWDRTDSYNTCILMDDESDPRKNRYICKTISSYNVKLLKDNRKKLKLIDYKSILKLHRSPKDTWRKQIQWYQEMQDFYFDRFFLQRYSEIEVPDDFEKKLTNTKQVNIIGDEEVRFQQYRQREIWSKEEDHGITKDLLIKPINYLKDSSKTVIWAERDQSEALALTYRLLVNFNLTANYLVISIPKKDTDLYERLSNENDNIISIDEWYLSENEVLECFVFFEKFHTLVKAYQQHSITLQPINTPYKRWYNRIGCYKDGLSPGFIAYLKYLFKEQKKELNLDGLKKLRSWYRIESQINKICINIFEEHNKKHGVLIATWFFPNVPLSRLYKKQKQNLLLIKSNK